MVDVVVETHTSSEDNEEGIASGWRDPPLSEIGLEQAVRLGSRRVNDGIAVVFSSDLQRATQTAHIAFLNVDIPIRIDPRLRECDYGSLSGSPADEVAARRSQHIDIPYPEGEGWSEAIERVHGFISELSDRYTGERVLVIGHIATRWAFRHFVEGAPIETLATERFEWQPGWEYIVG